MHKIKTSISKIKEERHCNECFYAKKLLYEKQKFYDQSELNNHKWLANQKNRLNERNFWFPAKENFLSIKVEVAMFTKLSA